MKKIFISLILILFSFNFSYAKLTLKEEKNLKTIVYNFCNKLEKNTGEKGAILKLKNILLKIDFLIKNKKFSGKKLELLDYIKKEINNWYAFNQIKKYYLYIESQELEKAFKMKIIDVWSGEEVIKKEFEKFKKMYNFGEKVKIEVYNFKSLSDIEKSFLVKINYPKSGKIETYKVIMYVNPLNGLLEGLLKTKKVNTEIGVY